MSMDINKLIMESIDDILTEGDIQNVATKAAAKTAVAVAPTGKEVIGATAIEMKKKLGLDTTVGEDVKSTLTKGKVALSKLLMPSKEKLEALSTEEKKELGKHLVKKGITKAANLDPSVAEEYGLPAGVAASIAGLATAAGYGAMKIAKKIRNAKKNTKKVI